MNPKITEIELLLDKINLLFAELKSDGHIDKLEAGLFLKYVKQLQEKIEAAAATSRYLPEKEIMKEPVVKKEVINEPVVKKDLNEYPVEEKPEIRKPEITEEKKATPEINIKAFEELQKQKEIIQNKEVPVAEKTKNKKQAIQIPEEDDEESNTGLNQKLLKDKKTLADKIIHKKASDLRTMIDLNDRIYFIRELFKGDSHAFDKAIKHINLLQSFNEANNYIEQELKHPYNWKADEAAERFIEVVGNKFN